MTTPPNRYAQNAPRFVGGPGARILGAPTPEEVAALLAVLGRRAEPEPDALTRWRRTRQAALRRTD